MTVGNNKACVPSMDGAFEYSRNPSRELLNALQKGKRGGQCSDIVNPAKTSSAPHDSFHPGRHESCLVGRPIRCTPHKLARPTLARW
jgi:hypothetical protein